MIDIDTEKLVSTRGIKYNRRKELGFDTIEDKMLRPKRPDVFPLMVINKDNKRILLSKPVEVHIFRESGYYVAENKNLRLRVEGSSHTDAARLFVEEFTINFEEYDRRMDDLIEEQIMKRYAGAWEKLAKL